MQCDSRTVAIVGCGKVGMSAAYALLLGGGVDKLYLVGRDLDQVKGEELDLQHGAALLHPTKIVATTHYQEIADADVVVFTAGASQKPGETRLDLLNNNLRIVEEIVPQVVAHAPNAVLVMVTNPVDILTYHAYKLANWPKGRIFGTGTTLDTARFRFHLAEFLKVNPRSIHAYILGEHGDSSFPALSSASVGGQPLMTLDRFSEEKAVAAFEDARQAAYKIIASKGATYYAIGVVISQVVRTILSDSHTVLPVSVPLHNYYGLYGMAASIPCLVGRSGVLNPLSIKLNWQEKQALEHSVEKLKKTYRSITK